MHSEARSAFISARTIRASPAMTGMHGRMADDGSGNAHGSAFLFLGLDATQGIRECRLLERDVPWLHAAVVRVSTNAGDEKMGACIDAMLSARELEVLRCMQQGMGNTAIGGALEISPHTGGLRPSSASCAVVRVAMPVLGTM